MSHSAAAMVFHPKIWAISSSCVCQLVEELVGKWVSFPEAQHIPLCSHLLGLSMKTVTQLALGEHFGDDAQVISFHKNHDVVRNVAVITSLSTGNANNGVIFSEKPKSNYLFLILADLVRNWERLLGRYPGEEQQQEDALCKR